MLDMTGAVRAGAEGRPASDLREPPFVPRQPLGLRRGDDLFAEIADHDVLLHHPFDSFDPVVDFIHRRAPTTRNVLAIKQTLYRTSGDSPIVRVADRRPPRTASTSPRWSSSRPASTKRTTSVWARQMERAGVHVVYGFMDLKTHCKLAMVVRQEGTKVRRYVHLGTGNYNPATARLYTDLGAVHRRTS